MRNLEVVEQVSAADGHGDDVVDTQILWADELAADAAEVPVARDDGGLEATDRPLSATTPARGSWYLREVGRVLRFAPGMELGGQSKSLLALRVLCCVPQRQAGKSHLHARQAGPILPAPLPHRRAESRPWLGSAAVGAELPRFAVHQRRVDLIALVVGADGAAARHGSVAGLQKRSYDPF